MKFLIASFIHLAVATLVHSSPSPIFPRATFDNPVLWEDLADLDVFRVDDTFYYSASTMHYSPGAPILRSYDLINWEFVGHSVPVLDFGSSYYLDGGRAYVRGIWASFLNYRPSNGLFYWGGCVDFVDTYIYTSSSVEGPWERSTVINTCYYDAGLLIDDDDTMYVAYGGNTINVAQLSTDGLIQVNTTAVFTSTADVGYIEGSRFYKKDGNYYILVTQPANSEYVLKSTSGPFGPYEIRPLVVAVGSPITGGGNPHQGGLVETQSGDWYYMAFVDSYPGGRVPVLAPISWDSNGWPTVELIDGAWGSSYSVPNIPTTSKTVKSPTGTDTFQEATLSPEWEWNHNPDNGNWYLDANGLHLQPATVTTDLYNAKNTLTHRILGPSSNGTIRLEYRYLADGARTGLALLRDQSAWIGVVRSGDIFQLAIMTNINMDLTWTTVDEGKLTTILDLPRDSFVIQLRASVDISPGSGRTADFSYSLDDGVTFIGSEIDLVLNNNWEFFLGYRYAIFHYATLDLGGQAVISSFKLEITS